MKKFLKQASNGKRMKDEKDHFFKEHEQYWDKKSVSYKRMNRNHKKKMAKIIELLNVKSGDKILEVGTGAGDHGQLLLEMTAERKCPIRYTGIDLSQKMVERTIQRLKGHEHVAVLMDNAEKMRFPDNTFDGVFCAATLHHLEHPEQGVKEMLRVLKPGGGFVLMEPHLWFPKNLFQTVFIKEERNNKYIRRKYYNEWIKKFAIPDAKIENFIYTIPFPKFLFKFYDFIDDKMQKVPLLKHFSIQLVLSGSKEK